MASVAAFVNVNFLGLEDPRKATAPGPTKTCGPSSLCLVAPPSTTYSSLVVYLVDRMATIWGSVPFCRLTSVVLGAGDAAGSTCLTNSYALTSMGGADSLSCGPPSTFAVNPQLILSVDAIPVLLQTAESPRQHT